jgi:hypothetical protein
VTPEDTAKILEALRALEAMMNSRLAQVERRLDTMEAKLVRLGSVMG